MKPHEPDGLLCDGSAGDPSGEVDVIAERPLSSCDLGPGQQKALRAVINLLR